MLRIGAHMSVAGGMASAVERAVLHRCESIQVFTRNANRWAAPPLDPLDVRRFRRRLDEAGIHPAVSHASYLINLASTEPLLRARSIDALADELDRAHSLGLLGVVLHPGTCTSGTEEDALGLIADALREVLARHRRRSTLVLLEHTAGQGRTVGYRFDHLAAIIERVDGSPRLGVCLDTCHLVAAGYDLASDSGYRSTFDEFDARVGFDRLKLFHGNDSKRPLGARVDRHAHIGDGWLGLEPFRRLLHDPRFDNLPILIETEKSAGLQKAGLIVADPLDIRNLDALRRLRGDAAPSV
jgi:deoxyribonuclease-4